MTEQAVVEDVDLDATQASETVDAQDEIDQLLSQYDEDTTPQVEQQKTDQSNDDLMRKVDELTARLDQDETNKSLDESVSIMKKNMSANIPDELLSGLIHKRASEDARFLKAFQNRRGNPGGWEKLLIAEAKRVGGAFNVDKSTTESVDAVASAVRSASTAKPTPDEAPNFRTMNAAQLDNHLRKG